MLGVVLLFTVVGCSPGIRRTDARERAEPLVERAAAKADAGDIDAAVHLYEEALDRDPTLSRAHLDLAVLLHDRDRDYVAAVYHYGRYLALRPDTQKKELIENRIRLARQAFAASILGPARPGEPAGQTSESRESAARILELEQENKLLKNKVAEMEGKLSDSRRTDAPAIDSNVTARAGGQAPRVEKRSYKVQRGDTLSSIAARIYGDSGQWRKLLEANRDRLRGTTKVEEGQTLIVP